MVIDGETVITGSLTSPKAAEESNAENLLIIHDKNWLISTRKIWQEHEKHSEDYMEKGRERNYYEAGTK